MWRDLDRHLLEASQAVSSDDALVIKLAESAVKRSGEGALKRAQAMRSRVYKHITNKSMATAFAAAAETAKTREGDCSEHAVLLCAMLRSQKIPARVATGLVYVPTGRDSGFFGWHMWTQAMIDGMWVELDATLPGRTHYHPGHITTAVSALSDDTGIADLFGIMALMGNLEIDVLEEQGP